MQLSAKIAGNRFAQLDAETRGFMFGLLGVLTFSFTLPMTRIAVAELDATLVGLGRAIIAALCAGGLLCSPINPHLHARKFAAC